LAIFPGFQVHHAVSLAPADVLCDDVVLEGAAKEGATGEACYRAVVDMAGSSLLANLDTQQ